MISQNVITSGGETPACDTVRMRRLLFPTIVAIGLVMVGSSGALCRRPDARADGQCEIDPR